MTQERGSYEKINKVECKHLGKIISSCNFLFHVVSFITFSTTFDIVTHAILDVTSFKWKQNYD